MNRDQPRPTNHACGCEGPLSSPARADQGPQSVKESPVFHSYVPNAFIRDRRSAISATHPGSLDPIGLSAGPAFRKIAAGRSR